MEDAATEKRPKTERSQSEMDTQGGGETNTFTEFQSRHKKAHMANFYLTDSNEEAIVDFVNDHVELYDKFNMHFKDKSRNDCL